MCDALVIQRKCPVRTLAVETEQRHPALPDVPKFKKHNADPATKKPS